MAYQITTGRILLSLVGLLTALGGWIVDFSDTHVFNPLWMPHAVFHCGQTITMGTCLGVSTLYYTWSEIGGSNKGKGTETPATTKERLNMAAWLAAMYWITLLSAWCFPNSAAADPPADPWQFPFPQFYLSVVMLVMVALGRRLEVQRLGRAEVTSSASKTA